MPKTIISDTSYFIILTNIGELELLHTLYGQIVTTLDIAIEYGEILPEWVEIERTYTIDCSTIGKDKTNRLPAFGRHRSASTERSKRIENFAHLIFHRLHPWQTAAI